MCVALSKETRHENEGEEIFETCDSKWKCNQERRGHDGGILWRRQEMQIEDLGRGRVSKPSKIASLQP